MGSLWDDYVKSFFRGDELPNLNGMRYIDTETAMKYTAVFSCIRVLSETLAAMPIMLYRKKKDGDRERSEELAVYDILHYKPNDEMSPYNFKESCMVALNTGGNTVCERLIDRYGGLVGLYPYPWSYVNIKRDMTTKKLIYEIRDIANGAAVRILDREQVFHIPGFSLNGVVGLSPIEYATQAIALGLSYEQFSANLYRNGVNSTGIFSFPQALSEEPFKRLKTDIKKNYAGMANTGTPIILEEGGSFTPLTIKPADAQMLESKKFQIEDIARIYRVPLHLIQNLDRATFNNIEHLSLEFVMYTMLPWFKRWEENINTQLLSQIERRAGYYLEFKIDTLLRGDAKSRADAYAIGRNAGYFSINDIRRLENLNSIENGDVYLQPLNMADVNIINEVQLKNKQDDKVKAMAEEFQKMIENKN